MAGVFRKGKEKCCSAKKYSNIIYDIILALWKRQRRPRYEDVDITKSKTVWTITPLLKRTGPVSEMESLAHQAVGRHEYQYGEERDQ
ncbi:uncharacterized protein LOC125662399 isoform X2 [Ostrea edulis]|uniref:uncharacterized protein LOC125662399 isoform X2 n=1 Tax=Ostrea edulis TaxID=37623 RepID=UPI0024AFB8BF|nr:uncharacterized protein LOC125662399 isoform X2 [Ostrea edulis]